LVGSGFRDSRSETGLHRNHPAESGITDNREQAKELRREQHRACGHLVTKWSSPLKRASVARPERKVVSCLPVPEVIVRPAAQVRITSEVMTVSAHLIPLRRRDDGSRRIWASAGHLAYFLGG
jgi:hypothetical protein